jgi:hypothetical protein
MAGDVIIAVSATIAGRRFFILSLSLSEAHRLPLQGHVLFFCQA